MIYFDNNKQAFAFQIPNYICTVEDNVWDSYAGTDKWDIIAGVFTDITNTSEYKEKQKQEERLIIDNLILTPTDVERALHKATGMDFEDLKKKIADLMPELDMKAIGIEFKAQNFYRGAFIEVPDETSESGVKQIRLIDTIGALLGYSSDDMDYLFKHKELPEKVKPEPTEEKDVEETLAEGEAPADNNEN